MSSSALPAAAPARRMALDERSFNASAPPGARPPAQGGRKRSKPNILHMPMHMRDDDEMSHGSPRRDASAPVTRQLLSPTASPQLTPGPESSPPSSSSAGLLHPPAPHCLAVARARTSAPRRHSPLGGSRRASAPTGHRPPTGLRKRSWPNVDMVPDDEGMHGRAETRRDVSAPVARPPVRIAAPPLRRTSVGAAKSLMDQRRDATGRHYCESGGTNTSAALGMDLLRADGVATTELAADLHNLATTEPSSATSGSTPPALEPHTHRHIEAALHGGLGRQAQPKLAAACPVAEWSKVVNPRFVGCGAFCNVFLATFEGREAAVKLLKPEHRENGMAQRDLVTEITLLRVLRHPHLPKLFATGTLERSLFMVMERLSGTLAAALPPQQIGTPVWTYIAAVRRWPLQRALRVSLDLAGVLAHCHGGAIPGVGVMHRDLKPDNIGFSAADGRLVLFDFGLAKLVPRTEGAVSGVAPRPMTGGVGSPRYMAPEVVLSRPYTFSSEVYSWSIILWQMVAHDKPFAQLSLAGHAEGVAKGGLRPPLSKRWPESLRVLLSSCWETAAAKRPTFSELVPRLREILGDIDGASDADLKKAIGFLEVR